MPRAMTWTLGALVLVLAAWTIGSMGIVARIEEAKYTVTATRDGYEIRRYEPYLIAETAMPTMSTGDRSNAFRAIAGYIFGGNETSQSIAMTAPVVMEASPSSQKIAMTAPVVMTAGTMQFVMSSRFKTLADLPKPKDPRVKLREQPAVTTAALRFSWYATEAKVAEKTAELKALLLRDNLKASSSARLASYDPPFSIPFLKRHEILVDVQ
jgi:hypothetical protein